MFDLSEQRQLDRACVDETKFEMLTLAEEAGLTGERLEVPGRAGRCDGGLCDRSG